MCIFCYSHKNYRIRLSGPPDPETIPGMTQYRPLIQAGRCILYLATRSNDLKFVGDCIEDITVTCFGLLASYQALSDHGVANDLNLVGDSVAKRDILWNPA